VKLDRVFRNVKDALETAEGWDKAKCGLHILDMGGNAVDTRTAMGKMFFVMAAAFAEMEKNLAGERTSNALVHLRKMGKVYTRVLPLGFDAVGSKKDRRLVPNKAEMATVRRIGKLREQGWSLGRIAEHLNKTNVKTKQGGNWYAVTVQKILANPLYKTKAA
jgi:DNA invertase Pin-like site-specific DNA recombinase